MDIQEVDIELRKILLYLESVQNIDGSFDTMYKQPYYFPNKGWMLYPTVGKTPFDVASALIPLLFCGKDTDCILQRGKAFLVENSLDCKFWSYAYLNKNYIVPYDSDSTSLSSFVLRELGLSTTKTAIFDKIKDKENNYKLWISSNLLYKYLSLPSKVKLFFRDQRIKTSIPLKSKAIFPSDAEFAVNCNVLLYLGYNDSTKDAWEKVLSDFISRNFDEIYYLNHFHSVYIFARLLGYGNHKTHLEKNQLESMVLELLKQLQEGHSDNFSLETILLTNTILLFNLPDNESYNLLFKKCFEDVEKSNYIKAAPYYSSNKKTDCQPNTNEPNTYFGSPAITCSLYIEFLNLYRKRFYGSFFGYD